MSFDLLPYSPESLYACCLDDSRTTTAAVLKNSRHLSYFQQYFQELKASTILVEKHYVDRDYLQDYADYYDRCFWDYPRRTRRLHFFSMQFTCEDFERALVDAPDSDIVCGLRDCYLGFIVIKPLAQTIIGRTCLKTYGDDAGRRNFPCLRSYPVNLYGLEFEVRTLAFQEQDRVVAACATSALWTCLQGTGKLFQHSIPAPVEITKWAGDQIPDNVVAGGARSVPGNGLTGRQMAHAIRRVDLEPHIIRTGNRYDLHSSIYAYLKGKIPSILSAQVIEQEGDIQVSRGAHAVAVTGYSLREDAEYQYLSTGLRLRAAKIDKLYIHDDQVGPFCRMQWAPLTQPEWREKEELYEGLTTSRGDSYFYLPDFILLPLYHKIRIPFSVIHDEMLALDRVMSNIRLERDPGAEPPEWDIYLTTVNEYKSALSGEYSALDIDFKQTLYAPMPRFLWRVTVRREGSIQMDFLFDATGVAQHSLLVNVISIVCDDSAILAHLAEPEFKELVDDYPPQARSVIQAFAHG